MHIVGPGLGGLVFAVGHRVPPRAVVGAHLHRPGSGRTLVGGVAAKFDARTPYFRCGVAYLVLLAAISLVLGTFYAVVPGTAIDDITLLGTPEPADRS